MENRFDIIVIGGSAGSLAVINDILSGLPRDFSIPVIVVVHRMRNVHSDLGRLLSYSGKGLRITEPDDKEPIVPGKIYLAPQNYHLLVEDNHISLDYSEPVLFSRPSIDVSFESVAQFYGERTLAILLSGANNDGAGGMKAVIKAGGTAIAQDPGTAAYALMPQAAIAMSGDTLVYTPHEIKTFIRSLQTR